MSKVPYCVGRVVVYAGFALIMGLGNAGAFSGCGGGSEDEPKVCTSNPLGERDCPIQTGRQDKP